jgi:hypothetical protein
MLYANFYGSIFCCLNFQPYPYRPRLSDHEAKFSDFMSWAKQTTLSTEPSAARGLPTVPRDISQLPYAVQLVRQVNFGPLETKRYFTPESGSGKRFVEVTEEDLVNANFEKLNSCVFL